MKLNRNFIITAPSEGGELSIYEDKNLMGRMFVPPGRHRLSRWLDLLQPGQTLEASEGILFFPPPSRTRLIVADNHLDGGAVQDFQPTNTSRVAQRLESALKRLDRLESVQTARREARHNARATASQKEAQAAAAAAALATQAAKDAEAAEASAKAESEKAKE